MIESDNTDIEAVEPQEAEPQEVQAEQPKQLDSTFIDYNELPENIRPKVQARIDADFRKNKELQRELQKAKETQRKLEQERLEAKKPGEVSPPDDDLWLSDPEKARQQLDQYSQSLAKQKDWEFENRQHQESLKRESEQQQQERIGTFFAKAKTAGLEEGAVLMAARIVDQSLPPELQSFLVGHDYAPQLVNRLASNPMELQELANLNSIEAGVKLDRMAQSFKTSRKSNAPPPDDPVKGNPSIDKPYGDVLGTIS